MPRSRLILFAAVGGFLTGCESSTDCCEMEASEGFWGPVASGVVRHGGQPVPDVVVAGVARRSDDCEGGDFFMRHQDTTGVDGIYEVAVLTFGGGFAGDTTGAILCLRLVAEPPMALGLRGDTIQVHGIPEVVLVRTQHTLDFELESQSVSGLPESGGS